MYEIRDDKGVIEDGENYEEMYERFYSDKIYLDNRIVGDLKLVKVLEIRK